MDGVTRVTVVSGLSNPWGLTVHQNYLYYTDRDYEVIERVDKDTGGNMVVMRSGMSGLHALKVHARDSKCIRGFLSVVKNASFVKGANISHLHQPNLPPSDSAGTTNACSTNNGGCPHLCLPKPGNKTCACTIGFYPSQDGTRCEQFESFAIVSTSKYIRGFHINSSDHSEAMVPVGGCAYASDSSAP